MSSLDRLPERGLAKELRRQRNDSNELKGSFQALGSSSVIAHRIFSPNTYDAAFTPSGTPGTLVVHRCDIEFIPDDKTFGGAFCYRVNVRIMDTSNNPIQWISPWLDRGRTSDGKQKWFFYYSSWGYASEAIRMKFYLSTTGSGTFTATVVT